MTIKAKVWGGAVISMVMTAALCAFALSSLHTVANLVVGIFERPLLISGEAGGISTAFVQMDRELTRIVAAQDPGAIGDGKEMLTDLGDQITASLSVIADRASDDGGAMVAQVESQLRTWRGVADAVVRLKSAREDVPANLLADRQKASEDLGNAVILLVEYALASGLEFRQDAIRVSNRADFILTVAAIIAVLVSSATSVWLLRGIVGPLHRITGIISRLAQGDTGVRVEFVNRRDEVGEMAGAVEVFKRHMIEVNELRTRQEDERVLAARERAAALLAMADQFEATVNARVAQVAQSTTEIRITAQTMADRSERSGGRSLDVGKAAMITTDRSSAAAAATQDLARSVGEVASQASRSAEIARQAVADVNATADRMDELSQAAQSIGEVVNLISTIARQTNLLALNATIEAARAGEAGRGFNVVANEVKNLANQTSRATEEIAAQVAAVQCSTGEMRNRIAGVVDVIRTMDQISHGIADAVTDQQMAAREISDNIDEVASQASEVSLSVTHMSQASAKACAGTIRVIWSATALGKVVEELKDEARNFLTTIRLNSADDVAPGAVQRSTTMGAKP